MKLLVQDDEGTEATIISELGSGDMLASLLSVVDLLSGGDSRFKSVTARAAESTTIVRIPVGSRSDAR